MSNVLTRGTLLCLLMLGEPLIEVAHAQDGSGGQCQAEVGVTTPWILDGAGELGGALNLAFVGADGMASAGAAQVRCDADEDCRSTQVCVSGRCRTDYETCNEVCDWVCDEWSWETVTKCEQVFGETVCWEEEERICLSWRRENCRCR